MSIFTAVKKRLSGSAAVVYECRNCGTVLETNEWTCSCCGSIEIAEYESGEYDVP
ncbi:hypothetical protein QA600_12915 [Natronococcus sp. A-GB1]|uniref:hypothetical protein n=1 Tax=Natronococcus sp. A-GB1 TaxID=3037648 RepID=UPI00241F0C0B|nr:hypothetical protein [Natronococcus sp. A-GB1]MDG5760238.1 hypothetical protein [Natronococcus sp. A-GB1]